MDKIKKCILIGVPTSICNLRCRYCYISQKQENFAETGTQANLQYSPEQWAKALSKERIGGPCYINICGGGETLLTKGISKYIRIGKRRPLHRNRHKLYCNKDC